MKKNRINKKLKEELLKMMKSDQVIRTNITKKQKTFSKVDKTNTKRFKKIVAKYGWPDKSLVGEKAALAAWLIAQHADHDVDFQQNCLKLILEKYAQDLVDSEQVAFLTDRVLVNLGKKQSYGTQFYTSPSGVFTFRPIKAIKTLSIRRRKMGLSSFTSYKKHMKELRIQHLKKSGQY